MKNRKNSLGYRAALSGFNDFCYGKFPTKINHWVDELSEMMLNLLTIQRNTRQGIEKSFHATNRFSDIRSVSCSLSELTEPEIFELYRTVERLADEYEKSDMKNRKNSYGKGTGIIYIYAFYNLL